MPAVKGRSFSSFKQRAIAVAVASCYLGTAVANPTGGTVASGSATISSSGNTLTVTNTPGAIINWQQFSIQKDEVTRFIQQNASSAVLNRVTTQNPSVILGTLTSNGRVFLINPSGIAFGVGSVINVAGLAASTLNISDSDFLSGRLRFVGTGTEGAVTNAGTITTPEGGHVYLIAPNVQNQAGGVITSPKGEVVIAAGQTVELVNAMTPDIRVEYTAPNNEAVNAGQIVAASGRIGVYGTLIRNSGLVSASRAEVGDGGQIVFKAVQDVTLEAGSRVEANGNQGGSVTVQADTGTLLAQGTVEAKGDATQGGQVQMLGKQVALDGTASVDASGSNGGGRVLIGGDSRGANPNVQNADAVYTGADTTVRADAGTSGDGGSVVLYSNNSTKVYGNVSAQGSATGNGGSVETSGRSLVITQGPNVSGGIGGGSWLIDPYNIEIVAGNGTTNNTGTPDFTPNGDTSQIGASLISNQLNAGTNVTVDTGGAGSPGTQAGNITVNGEIRKTAINSSSLTLNAASDLTVNFVAPTPPNPPATIFMQTGDFQANAGGNMTVNANVTSQTMTVNVGGTLSVVGSGGAIAGLGTQSGQTINAGALKVTANGASANISNSVGVQSINVTGGSVDVVANATSASINGGTGLQSITVTNGDHITVNAAGAGSSASISSGNGTQNVSITGSGANAITVGTTTLATPGALGGSQISGALTQTVTAGATGQSGSITIIGADTNNSSSTISTNGSSSGTQGIFTTGALSVTGGRAPNQASNRQSGVFHQGGGDQTIQAGSISVQGGPSGNNNGALVSNNSNSNVLTSGKQAITVTGGSISVTGGTAGAGNFALLRTVNGDQTIDGNPVITVTGGASGGVAGSGNSASIQANGTGRKQTINAGSLTLTSGAGGTDNSSSVLGNIQSITVAGDVRVSGSGSSGNSSGSRIGSGSTLPTDLTLTAGGDVVLTGGNGTLAGARLGAGTNATPVDSKVKVTAGGNVVLNSSSIAGSGSATIGYSVLSVPGGGAIDVTAGNAIQFNGGANATGIRTTGDATLTANTIDGASSSLVLANSLTTKSTGTTSLVGANQVSSLNATTTAGDLNFNNSVIAPATALSFGMSVNGNATVTNNGNLTVTGGATSTGNQTINVNGGSLDVIANSGAATLAATGPGAAQSITVTNGDHITVFGAGAGSSASITANSGTQSISITGSGANAITVGTTTATPAPSALGASSVSALTQTIKAGDAGQSGSITILGSDSNNFSSAIFTNSSPTGTQAISTSGAINITGGRATNQASNRQSGIFHSGQGMQSINAASISLKGGPSGNGNSVFIGSNTGGAALGGEQVVTVTGGIDLKGGGIGVSNRASITVTNANQTINAAGALTVTGGDSGGVPNSGNSSNSASISDNTTLGGPIRTQAINAGSISLTGGAGGTENYAAVVAAKQNITSVGDVKLTGGNSDGVFTGARMGGQGGAAPTATDLTLTTITGDVILTGGSQANAGARLGSTGLTATTPATPLALDNKVTVNSAGNVVLNEGTAVGAAIGYSALGLPSGGDINVTAGNTIQMNGGVNGTAIRTTGNVELHADRPSPGLGQPGGSITQSSASRILANNLTTTSTSDTLLQGQNQVSAFNGTTTANPNTSAGFLTLNNIGALNLAMDVRGGEATITNNGSVTVTGHASSFGNQTINVNGGSLDVIANSGVASISTTGLGAAQSITVTNGDHITVMGAGLGTLASISAGSGTQNISITGTGANAITVGTTTASTPPSALGTSNISALSQTVTAGAAGTGQSGSITILGADANNANSAIFTNTGSTGTQAISTSGAIGVTGGRAPSQLSNRQSGIFHGGQGQQSINAGSIALNGGPSGSGNGASISSNGNGLAVGGEQVITVTGGGIDIKGGGIGVNNRASIIVTNANQTINSTGAITVTGGDSGGAANSSNSSNGANITDNTTVGPVRTQTISAGSIELKGGAGGTENFAAITASKQIITSVGDVKLTGGNSGGVFTGARIGGQGGAAPTATDLTLTTTAGDVILTGGSQANAGARLGSSGLTATTPATPVALDNKVTVNASGNVILNEGPASAAAIGYSALGLPAGGDINVTAGNSIQLNGVTNQAVIRTTGNVALNAATITQGSNGRVLANSLATNTSGSTGLGGQNQVSSFNGSTTAGDLTLNNAGSLNLALDVKGSATVTNAGSVTVTGLAQSTGNQTISVNGGNLDVQSTGAAASLKTTGAGAVQTIAVTNGDRISVNGAVGDATIGGSGVQNVSITGTGANAIIVGSAGATGQSNLIGPNQIVTAGAAGEAGSITVTGTAANGKAAWIQGAGGTQSVSTSGTLAVNGGSASAQIANFNSGVFHAGSGPQTINAASIALQAGSVGSGNGAIISSTNTVSGGPQFVTAGNISVTGGGGGANNRAAITTNNANQTIDGNPTITLTGGAAGANNTANIGANGLGRTQTIGAGSISIAAGASGTDNSSTITGNIQNIEVAGNVTVTGGGAAGNLTGARIGGGGTAAPTSTNLTLTAGGDVVLTGGSQQFAGARLGSTVSATPLDSNVTVNASNVILNEGTGVGGAIGYSTLSAPGGGTINVNATNSIQMNGVVNATSIRTTGNVNLNAATITQGTNGRILANALNTTTSGITNLVGQNQVASFNGATTSFGGNLTLNNSGTLSVTGLGVLGDASITNAGTVNITGASNASGSLGVTATGAGSNLGVANVVSSGGAMTINASGDLTVAANGAQSASLVSNGGQSISAHGLSVSASNGGSASITSMGDQTITINGGGTGAGLDVQTVGTGPSSASILSTANQTIAVVDADHINLNNAAGGVVSVSGSNGTQMLSITGSGANAIVVGSSGALGTTQVSGGNQSVTAGLAGQSGSISIIGTGVSTPVISGITGGAGVGTAQTISTSGALNVTGGSTTAGNSFTGIFNSGTGPQNVSAASITVQAGNGTGNAAQISSFGAGVAQSVTAGDILVKGGTGNTNSALISSNGKQTVSATNISLQGGAGGTNAARIATFADGANQVVNAGTISLAAGATGSNNNALLTTAGANATQEINAGSVSVQGGLGGSNNVASVATSGSAASQKVTAASLSIKGGELGSGNTANVATNGSGANQVVNAGTISQTAGASGSNNGAFVVTTGANAAQAINAGSITLQGGLGGNTNLVSLSTSGTASTQTVTAASIALKGGAAGNGNRATMGTVNGDQNINGNPTITVNGGDSGGIVGTPNLANITTGGVGRTQTIHAGSITLKSGAGGTDNSASITGDTQSITVVGDVNVSGSTSTGGASGARIGGIGGTTPGATRLTLNVGGDVILQGGDALNSGGGLGGAGSASAAATNTITVDAGGNVILNEGAGGGGRIGYSTLSAPSGGNISVTAGGEIQLNGTTRQVGVRTLGDVTLNATKITGSGTGVVLANNLTTQSTGTTDLSGANQVASFNGTSTGGNVNLNNLGALNLAGLSAAGSAALSADAVNGAGNVSTGSGFTVTVAGDSLLSGVISGAGGLNKSGGGTLTVSGDNTYAGDTNVLAGTLALGGTDRSNGGVVNISSGATYRGSAGSFTNAGVIGGNGTLDVSATSFTNSGTLRPGGSNAIGTLTVAGNATLGSSSVVEIEAQSAASHDVLAVTGSAALGGNLNVTPINGYAPANGDTLTPLTYASRSGTVFVPGTWLPTYNPTDLKLGFDDTINRWVSGTGDWNVAANWSRGHTPLASETVLIDVPGTQLVTLSDGTRFGGKLVSFEDFLMSGGSLTLGGASAFNGALTLAGGTLQGAGSINATGSFMWTGGKLGGGGGQFTTGPGSIVTLAPVSNSLKLGRDWQNQGFVTWQGANGKDLVIAEGATLVNALGGVVTLFAAEGSNIRGKGSFANDGTLNMNGTGLTAIGAPFTNGPTGVLNVNSGTLQLKRSDTNEGAIGIASGATLKVNGGYLNNGTVWGNGTLDPDGQGFTNLGVVAPGAASGAGIGTLTIRGDYYQGVTGVLSMGLGGTAAGLYDTLAVTGKVFLGGTLLTSAVNGYTPTAADSFTLLTYKSRSGQFATLQAPPPLQLGADYEKRFGIFTLE